MWTEARKKNGYNLYQPKLQKSGSGLRRSSSWRKFKDTVRDTVTGMVQKTVKSGSVGGGSGDTVNLMSSLDNEEVEDLAPEVPPPPPPGLATSSFFCLLLSINDLPSAEITHVENN